MLSKEEMKAFLAALLAFGLANQLSAARLGVLLGISHATMARWIKLARENNIDGLPTNTTPRYMADPVIAKLAKLNKINEDRGLYEAISGQSSTYRVDSLQRALDGRLVW